MWSRPPDALNHSLLRKFCDRSNFLQKCLGLCAGRNEHLADFESRFAANQEDRRRERGLETERRKRRLRRSTALGLNRLARRIRRSRCRQARSLACATYFRDVRQRVVGQLWALVDRTQDLDPRTCTMFPRGWEVPAGQLDTFDPRARLNAVRSLINRCGGTTASGYLVAFIHGEFEPRRQVYQMHLHLLAAGGMRDVLDKVVRHTPSVRSNRCGYGVSGWVQQRLRFDRRLTNLPAPLTYMLKTYWPSKWQGFNEDGKIIRQRHASRIPEPYHTEVLRWFDRWQLRDLTLIMNISIGRDGFCLADRAYTNGVKK